MKSRAANPLRLGTRTKKQLRHAAREPGKQRRFQHVVRIERSGELQLRVIAPIYFYELANPTHDPILVHAQAVGTTAYLGPVATARGSETVALQYAVVPT